MRPAVEISYFTPEAQIWLFEAIEFSDATPSHAQTLRMRKFADQGRLTKGEEVTRPVCHPISSSARKELEEALFSAYEQKLNENN